MAPKILKAGEKPEPLSDSMAEARKKQVRVKDGPSDGSEQVYGITSKSAIWNDII